MKKYLILLAFGPIFAQAQPFARGLVMDDAAYEAAEKLQPELTRAYTILPAQASLKAWAPYPNSQGQYGTCTAWASAYAARSILEAQSQGWTDRSKITQEAYSPGFLYFYIKSSDDRSCGWGSFIQDAIEVMKTRGVPKYNDFNMSCVTSIPAATQTLAQQHKIQGGARLFDTGDAINFKVAAVKKALAEARPVIIGMTTPPSFDEAKEVWYPRQGDWCDNCGHAMCVIGYDDNKFGGAFEFQNSWGRNWGKEGYTWVRYADFGRYVNYGFVAYPKPVAQPVNASDFVGRADLQIVGSERVMIKKITSAEGTIPRYNLQQTMLTGSNYRLLLSNKQASHVYVFGGDDGNSISKLFPHQNNISSYLPYRQNEIAVPNEQFSFRAGAPVGKDYLVILFSREALDANALQQKFQTASGGFVQRANQVFRPYLGQTPNTAFAVDALSFRVNLEKDKAVAMILEIPRS
jgi:hypothetical protein